MIKLQITLVLVTFICNNSSRLQICIRILSHTNQLFFRATNRLPGKTTLVALRNGVCDWLEQHKFATLSTLLVDKMCILLFSSY